GLAFDPLAYFWNMPGRGGGFLETIIELFTTLISIGKQDVGSNNERFFELAVEELIRAALVLLSAAGEAISIVSIHNLIVSLPVSPDQIENDQWQSESACGQVIQKIRSRFDTLPLGQQLDVKNAITTALTKWAVLADRTKTSVEATWSGMASKFTY